MSVSGASGVMVVLVVLVVLTMLVVLAIPLVLVRGRRVVLVGVVIDHVLPA